MDLKTTLIIDQLVTQSAKHIMDALYLQDLNRQRSKVLPEQLQDYQAEVKEATAAVVNNLKSVGVDPETGVIDQNANTTTGMLMKKIPENIQPTVAAVQGAITDLAQQVQGDEEVSVDGIADKIVAAIKPTLSGDADEVVDTLAMLRKSVTDKVEIMKIRKGRSARFFGR